MERAKGTGRRKDRWIILLFLSRSFAAPSEGNPADAFRVVARIGVASVITEEDLRDWRLAQACYGPEASTDRRAGFLRLLEAALQEEVLRRDFGIRLSRLDLEQEARRMERETRAPEVLSCVQNHFRETWGLRSRPRYLRVYVRPVLVHRMFRERMSGQAIRLRGVPPPVDWDRLKRMKPVPVVVGDPGLARWLASIQGNPWLGLMDKEPARLQEASR